VPIPDIKRKKRKKKMFGSVGIAKKSGKNVVAGILRRGGGAGETFSSTVQKKDSKRESEKTMGKD